MIKNKSFNNTKIVVLHVAYLCYLSKIDLRLEMYLIVYGLFSILWSVFILNSILILHLAIWTWLRHDSFIIETHNIDTGYDQSSSYENSVYIKHLQYTNHKWHSPSEPKFLISLH